MAIKNIIFDMGGVLLDIDRERCVEAFAAIGFPQAEQLLSQFAQIGVLGELESGHIAPSDFFDYIRRESGRPTLDADIAAALNRFITGMPLYKLQMLRDLRPRFGIYMLSNTNAVMLPSIQAKYFTRQGLTFDDYFDRAFFSFEMGMMKPGEEIFRRMTAEAGFRPEECLFIDDGAANVATAARLGFHTYLPALCEDFRAIFQSL